MEAPADPSSPIEILTGPQVAVLLGLDSKTVYASAARGELPARKLGRRWIFERGAILAWLRETRSEPPVDREVRGSRLQPSKPRQDLRAKTRAASKRATR